MYLMLLKNNPDKILSPNFTAEEFLCRCNYDDCNFSMLYYKTLYSSQLLRNRIGPLITTSGHRCQKHNSDVGGAKDSYHMKGHAIDFVVPNGWTIIQFAKEARMFFDFVKEYPNKNFIHCHNL